MENLTKNYWIAIAQLLLQVIVCAILLNVPFIADFLSSTTDGMAISVASFSLILLFVLLIFIYYYRQVKTVNFILLGILTLFISILVGFACAYIGGDEVVLEAAVVTTIQIVCLSLYTFTQVRHVHDSQALGPFIFFSYMAFICFSILQVFLPCGKNTMVVFEVLRAISISGRIIYDINIVIKRYEEDEYVWASVHLYLSVIIKPLLQYLMKYWFVSSKKQVDFGVQYQPPPF